MTTMDDDKKMDEGWVTIDLTELDDAEPEADDETEKAKTADDEDVEDRAEAPRKSRAQERIRNLVAERKKVEEEAGKTIAQLKAELEELKTREAQTKKTSFESQKTLIDNQISLTKDALRKALEEGDNDRILELHDKLADLKVDKRIAEAQSSKTVVPRKTEKQETQKAVAKPADIPEEMAAFLDDNPWVLAPQSREERRKVFALREISNALIKEGYAEDEPDFYDELEARLEKQFGSDESDDVDYTNKQDKKADRASSSKDVKQRRTSPVGSSKSPPPASRRGQVRLSPEERATAHKLNLTEQQYALRKKQIEDAGDGGWVTLG